MPHPTLTREIRAAARAARQAGAHLLRSTGAPRHVRTKRSAADLVTEADRTSERLIHRLLRRACPEIGFLGEEHGTRRGRAARRWIVDPLDGTTNFVHGLPFFAVSIGLQAAGTLQAGVIYDPVRRELFVAVRGHGAFLNGRRLAVSRTRSLSRSLLSTGFAPEFRRRPTQYLAWFKALESRSHAVRRMGSTALSLAYVAAGRFDGFYEAELWPWDIAAGLLLVQEAEGVVTDFRGRAVNLEHGWVVASNGRIHPSLLRVLSSRPRGSRAGGAGR